MGDTGLFIGEVKQRMTKPQDCKIIIEGVTEDGRTFRPSDWIERISGSLSTFGADRRIRYSRYLQPQMLEGKKCLAVDPGLRETNPAAFKFLMDFARGNRLRVQDQCAAREAAAAEKHAEKHKEASGACAV